MKRLSWTLVLLLSACGGLDPIEDEGAQPPSDDSEEGDVYQGLDGKADSTYPKTLTFKAACAAGDRLTIAAVGDVLLHGALQQQAFAQKSKLRYGSLWNGVADLLAAADTTYANFEGPAAAGVNSAGKAVNDPGLVFDGVVYTSYPMFNYNPALAEDLVKSGVDVVSTANNHSVDRRSLGADRTLDTLDAAKLAHTGTRRAGDTSSPWYTTTNAKGISVAWLACTYDTNGIPDSKHQVLGCYKDTAAIEGIVRELAGRREVSAVIVTPHWGIEYTARPNADQTKLAHRLLEAGATAIIGSHPHVTEPWEKYTTADGRETFVIYSLGNFVSGQTSLPRRSSLLLYLGLTRDEQGRAAINGVRYLPLYMNTAADGKRGVVAIDRAGGFKDSRALTVGMFGTTNLIGPADPLVTNPGCPQ